MEISIGVILLVILAILLIYLLWNNEKTVWSSQNIPGPKPYPIIGNFYSYINPGLRKMDIDWIDKYGEIVGTYEGAGPCLVVKDSELLKQVLVKDFDNFTNTRTLLTGTISDSFLTNLFDDDWKRVRAAISPAFSASKLKHMNKGINNCCEIFIQKLHEEISQNGEVEIKDVCSSFTIDIIAKTGFGVDIDAQKDRDKNPFVINAKKLFDQSFLTAPLIILIFLFPKLGVLIAKLFKFNFFPRGVLEFFTKVVEQTIAARSNNEEKHTDLLQMMLSSQDNIDLNDDTNNTLVTGHKNKLNRDEILAQGILFFLAGYDTISSSLAMFFYCIAENSEHQEKIYEEIRQLDLDKDVGYEVLSELPHLNMCIDESLRLYPPASRVDRWVTKANGIKLGSIHMPQYSAVIIPVLAIHYDPELYPEPDKFIPQRFTPEEKANRNAIHYLPFGFGPRNCIAMRLALVQMKMAAVHIIRNFKMTVGAKTQQPITFKNNGQMHVEGGLYLNLSPRSEMN